MSRKKSGEAVITTVRNLPKLDRKEFFVGKRDGEKQYLEREARKDKMNNIIAKYQPRNAVTSKTAAKNIMSRCIHFCGHSFTKNVFEFLHGVAGEKMKSRKGYAQLTNTAYWGWYSGQDQKHGATRK